MNKPKLLLLGAGGHARACIDVIESEDRYSIIGLIGLPAEVGQPVLGYKVIGTDADLVELKKQCDYAIVAQGQICSPEMRIKSFNLLMALGYRLPRVFSKTAYVSPSAEVGEGTIVMHGAIINAVAKVGLNCIINSGSVIEHDVAVGDHSHISTGAILNGSVKIKEGTFIGSNSVLKNGIKVGANCVIGMGLSIKRDVSDQTTLKGS